MRPTDANMPRPILVALDLEQDSLLVHHAAVQARRTDARVILAHVIPPDPGEKISCGMVRFANPARCRAVLDKLEFAALQLLWQGILCDPVVLSGDPAEQIAQIARARGADRVLVAARASSAGSPFGDSSIEQRLLGELDVPLFVLGSHVSTLPEADASDGRILLFLSLHHDRPEYVRYASRLAREARSRLVLLHIVSTSGLTEQQRQQVHIRARRQLAALAASEPDPLFPIQILVREGDVVQTIVEETMCPHRDLIVLGTGSSHHGAAARNGIIHEAIANARCPVVALRPPCNAQTDRNKLPAAMAGAAD